MSRTNIDLDDDVLAVIMRRYGVSTKTEAVDLALRSLAGQPLSTTEALAMRGRRSIGAVPSESPIESA
jgi:Arc/MetJ family transcription regulator